MAMTLTDYQVLSDGPFEIDSIVDGFNPVFKVLKFDLPNNFTVGTNRARPILKFLFKTLSKDGKFGYWINVSNNALSSTNQTGLHSWDNHLPELPTWECIQGDKFRPGENRVTFGFQPGHNATVRIRDVVIWYQRHVDA